MHHMRHAHRSHGNLVLALVITTLVVDVVGTALVYWFESVTLGDSLFWTTTQLLTISSQMSLPETTGGKVVDVFLEVWGLFVVTTLAGSWAAFFHHRRSGQHRST